MDRLMQRVHQRIQLPRRALATLQELTPIASPTLVERDAAIQRFEYSTEACWKAAQSVLSVQFGLALASPKSVIRASAQNALLTEVDARLAMDLVDDRNLTAHTYNEALAQAIWSRLPHHLSVLQRWLVALEQAAKTSPL
jgi:nucleotidyltransferase substrate binding protein (TIGR01987 family)